MRRAFSTSSSKRRSLSSIHCCAIISLASLDSSRLSQRLSRQRTTCEIKPIPTRITAATTVTSHASQVSHRSVHWTASTPQRQPALEHRRNIGGAGGIGKQHLLQLCGAHATPYGHSKDVNDLFGMGTIEVRAENTLAAFFDYDLVAGRGFSHMQGAKPLRRIVPVDAKLEPLGVRGFLREPRGRQCRHREDHTGTAHIVRRLVVACQ